MMTLNKFEKDLILLIQNNLSNSVLDRFFFIVTDLHKDPIFIFSLILPLIGFWLWKERRVALVRLMNLIFLLLINDFICGKIIKKIVMRPRPFNLFSEIVQKSPASGYSFVSNHAANMFVLYFFLSYFYPKLKYYMLTLFLIVSFSRVYNGVHFFTDVLAGAGIGYIISWVYIKWLMPKIMSRSAT